MTASPYKAWELTLTGAHLGLLLCNGVYTSILQDPEDAKRSGTGLMFFFLDLNNSMLNFRNCGL